VFPLSTMFSSLCSFSNLSSVFFLKNSPFSRLAPLSVTTLLSFSKILPPLVFLSFSKNRPPSCFLFSQNFSPHLILLPLLFISRKRRCPPLLCPIVVQGGNGLPYLCGCLQGKVSGCLQGMVSFSFIYHVGRVCGSMGCCQFYASGRERK